MGKNNRFIQFRKDLGLDTQEKASEALGLHLQTIKNLDKGNSPDIETMIKLSNYFKGKKEYKVDIISVFKKSINN